MPERQTGGAWRALPAWGTILVGLACHPAPVVPVQGKPHENRARTDGEWATLTLVRSSQGWSAPDRAVRADRPLPSRGGSAVQVVSSKGTTRITLSPLLFDGRGRLRVERFPREAGASIETTWTEVPLEILTVTVPFVPGESVLLGPSGGVPSPLFRLGAGPSSLETPAPIATLPFVHPLHVGCADGRRYRLYIVSANFPADRIPRFRAAAGQLAERLLADPAFVIHREHLEIYRVDIADPDRRLFARNGPECDGDTGCCAMVGTWDGPDLCGEVLANETPPAAPCAGSSCLAFDVRLETGTLEQGQAEAGSDAATGPCGLWPVVPATDFAAALRVVPHPDAIVVIADINPSFRMGVAFTEADPPVAVIGPYGLSDPGTLCADIFLHEVGHLMGLEDEDGADNTAPSGEWPNLVSLPCLAPWHERCASGDLPCGNSAVVDSGCSVIGEGFCDNCACCSSSGTPWVGAFETRFQDGFVRYRSQQCCRMKSADAPMCIACRLHIRDVLAPL